MKYIVVGIMLWMGCVASGQAPTTQPAAGEKPPIKLLILRFDQIDQTAGMQWIGRAVQQSLVAEAVRVRALAVITPTDQTLASHSTTDQSVAQKLGADAGADDVLLGSYQIVEQELRITGTILNVSSGKEITSIKATGAVHDLFEMEDDLADQMKRRMLAIYAPPAREPAVAPVALRTPLVAQQEGSLLRQALRYKRSSYESYKSDREARIERNYYYSYPTTYCGVGYGYCYGYVYGGYGCGYCPWYLPGRQLPAQMLH